MIKAYKVRNKITGEYWDGSVHNGYTGSGTSYASLLGLTTSLQCLKSYLKKNITAWINDHEIVELIEQPSSIRLKEII